ncbi:MAG: DinB family protein [Ferruginibacter sp.]|nr:DinB family protein [Ferruginibacter sp.]
MKKITKPTQYEHADYYHTYIKLVSENVGVLEQLKNNAKQIETLILSLTEHQLTTAYAKDKWSIKDIVQHIIDCERVFLYRAMRFARNDKSAQPFFDENEFAKAAKASSLPIKKLLKEYKTARQATLAFFDNQNADTLKRAGIAGNTMTTVRAIAWIICGHELHHWNVINEKYL